VSVVSIPAGEILAINYDMLLKSVTKKKSFYNLATYNNQEYQNRIAQKNFLDAF
jgi:hypothetical protein